MKFMNHHFTTGNEYRSLCESGVITTILKIKQMKPSRTLASPMNVSLHMKNI